MPGERAARATARDHVHLEYYIYEPDPESLFAAILPGYVRSQVWRSLLESAAAEHAARMTAMDSATKNATELTEALTLHMNRVRQASITTSIRRPDESTCSRARSLAPAALPAEIASRIARCCRSFFA